MTTPAGQLGRYRFWGDKKPDTDRPLLTITRPVDRLEGSGAGGGSASASDGTTTATLRIYGPVDSWGGWWGVSAQEVASALDLLGDVDNLIVRVNSPGGEAFEGRAIMNLLRANKAHCIAVVDGLAASAASYISVGCDETVMSPGTSLMIHDTHTIVYGDAAGLRKEADRIDSISNAGAELYASVAGGTVEQWRELQRAETWYTAAEAVAAGLADRVDVVPDAGPAETAAEDPTDPIELVLLEDRAHDSYDLTLFRHAGRDQAPAPETPGASAAGSITTTTQEGSTAVPFSDEQLTQMRTDLGLQADADEATIVAALREALEERAEGPSTTTQVPEGMVLVESDVLAGLRDQAGQGALARQQQLDERRDRTIDQAVADGRITPARREHWVNAWNADAEGAEQQLASLAPGLVPLEERGHDQSTKAGGVYDELYGHESKGA